MIASFDTIQISKSKTGSYTIHDLTTGIPTGVPGGAGPAYPSKPPELTPGF